MSRPSDCLTVISAGRVRSSKPFGPSTLTWPGSRVTFTAPGTSIGSFPIRDNSSCYLLPDICQHLAAQALAQRLAPAHDPFSGAEDGNPEATEDPGDLRLARVDPQSGAADPLQPGDHASAVRAGLEDDTHGLGDAVGLDLKPGDVTLVLQHPGDFELQLRGRHLHLWVTRRVRVPDAREHVRDGVVDDAGRDSLDRFGDYGCHHQLDFVTPGMRPSAATLRKQMRHIPKMRR